MTISEFATTYAQLLERVISEGITAARESYADDPDKLQGAVEGFEACRHKLPPELVDLWKKAEADAHDAYRRQDADYWRWRCRVLEIEWVCNVVSVALVNSGSEPLLAHLPTMRAAARCAEIVGVRGQTEAP